MKLLTPPLFFWNFNLKDIDTDSNDDMISTPNFPLYYYMYACSKKL